MPARSFTVFGTGAFRPVSADAEHIAGDCDRYASGIPAGVPAAPQESAAAAGARRY
jgi:hypothetical protein